MAAFAAIFAQLLVFAPGAAVSATGLTAEVYTNSVMRGAPLCTKTVANGFSSDAKSLCSAASAAPLVAGQYSIRLTGTLTAAAAAAKWYAFTATVSTAMVRLATTGSWTPVDPERHDTPGGGTGAAPPAPIGYTRWPSTNTAAEKNEFPPANGSGNLSPNSITLLVPTLPSQPQSSVVRWRCARAGWRL
jgi:hypothetical protein